MLQLEVRCTTDVMTKALEDHRRKAYSIRLSLNELAEMEALRIKGGHRSKAELLLASLRLYKINLDTSEVKQ